MRCCVAWKAMPAVLTMRITGGSWHDRRMTLIAACQLALAVGESEANRAAARAAVLGAAEAGARLVVLPELVNSGYVFDGPGEARDLAEHRRGPTVSGWVA